MLYSAVKGVTQESVSSMETEAILVALGEAFACDRSCLGWSSCKGAQKFELCGRKQRLAMVRELERRFKECQETEEKVDK